MQDCGMWLARSDGGKSYLGLFQTACDDGTIALDCLHVRVLEAIAKDGWFVQPDHVIGMR